jgi:hypothetical protein
MMEVEMTVRTLLLGTAAGLVAISGAQAADMPVKAAPVNYVKICSLYGDGFYYIPGTDTCLKLGGYLRVQAEYNAGAGGIITGSGTQMAGQGRFTRDLTNDINYRVRAVTSWDVRQQTEYGTLRTYIRFGVSNETPAGTGGGSTPSAFWDRAFMQFAGFTVGRSQSFFDLFTYGGAYSYHNVRVSGDTGASGQNLWAYTAQFGNGFSGTLSLEDPATRKGAGTVDLQGVAFFGLNGGTINDNGLTINPTFGFRVPDVVANLRVDQAWGFAGISAALHDASGAYYNTAPALNGCGITGNCVNNGHPEDRYGWALAGGAKFNLAGGDMIGFNVCYSEGAAGMCTNQQTFQLYNNSDRVGLAWIADGVFANGTQIELTKVWSALAAYEHIWNPKWRTAIGGGYVNVDYGNAATNLILARTPGAAANCGVPAAAGGGISAAAAFALNAGNSCSPDYSFWEAYTRTQWNPVPQLDIGLQVMYQHNNTAFKGPATLAANGSRPAVINGVIDDQNVWSAMFRWQRNFYP